jgi:hypothetical protein
MPHDAIPADASASSPLSLLREGWRSIPPAHFAIAAGIALVWGLANALGWWIGGSSRNIGLTSAHFIYESLLTLMLLALGIGVADAVTHAAGSPRSAARAIAPYAIAVVVAAVLGAILFMLTAPLLGLASCACSMDRWEFGARTANMLPDSLLICGFVTAGYRYRRRAAQRLDRLYARELDRAQLTRRTLESRLQAMQACIEPEFLFDTLAEVERRHASDPRTAVRLIDELIVYLRAALPHLRESTSTVAKETELVQSWLNIQRLRHGRGPALAIDVGPGAEGASMPPMVLLPLVDYVLGDLGQCTADCALHIGANAAEGRLRISLAANGAAGMGAETGADKLAGLRERLHTLHGDAAHLTLGSDDRYATRITLDLPHERTDRDHR